jgi:8-oxo-dGTP diphosphatase
MTISCTNVEISLFVLSLLIGSTASWQNQPLSKRVHHTARYATTAADPSFPRAAVSVAVRCSLDEEVHYLLVQRGSAPNSGMWSFPGGKLELGETALEGGRRELMEETLFSEQSELQWFSGTISTADSILPGEDGSTKYHFLIAICFAELKSVTSLPEVKAADDAADAKWWTMDEMRASCETHTPGLLRHMERAETLYQSGVL